MEAPEFKDFAKEMVDYIANYLENIRERYFSSYLLPSKKKELIEYITDYIDGTNNDFNMIAHIEFK